MMLVYHFPPKDQIGFWTYVQVIGFQLIYSMASNMMFVSQCAFFARISDESIGGTYMTLVNTIANLGSTWPKFFVLYFVDLFTLKSSEEEEILSPTAIQDGYFVVGSACVFFGICWFSIQRHKLLQLQSAELKVWRLNSSSSPVRKTVDAKLE